MTLTETITIGEALGAVTVLIVSAVVVLATVRKSIHKALQSTADGWRGLAEQRASEIEDLKGRVQRLEKAKDEVTTERDELRAINLSYQRKILELESDFRALNHRVASVQTSVNLAAGLATVNTH